MRCAAPTCRQPARAAGQPAHPAGRAARAAAGTAARIFTGAQVPAGADAVVMQEQCAALDGGVRIDTVPRRGQWIRRRGEDVQRGASCCARRRLTPQAMGLAASVGAATLPCRAGRASRCSPPATSW
jgi:molybdopterin molybdotransferase